ncbi:uncharacterized protein VTP21DRAFT_10635 [Calcarisporiella thermophila]|uniref:uncharacterized protein n=1 Tax=Calcarisporiella thermophila TaxID=911321 RepID=UPI0037447BA6
MSSHEGGYSRTKPQPDPYYVQPHGHQEWDQNYNYGSHEQAAYPQHSQAPDAYYYPQQYQPDSYNEIPLTTKTTGDAHYDTGYPVHNTNEHEYYPTNSYNDEIQPKPTSYPYSAAQDSGAAYPTTSQAYPMTDYTPDARNTATGIGYDHNSTSKVATYNNQSQPDPGHHAEGTSIPPSGPTPANDTEYMQAAKPLINPDDVPRPPPRKWRPWFTWFVTAVQICVLIAEFVIFHNLTDKWIETSPFNVMIGPSAQALVYEGGRFVPCMRPTNNMDKLLPCPNSSNAQATAGCSLTEVCGFNGFPSGKPDQWFRFITPIFLHGGIVHLLFNLLFQLRTGAQLETDLGPLRFGLIYLISGIGGFIFGGNFAPTLITSTGASGSLFGLIGCLVIDIVMNYHTLHRPGWELTKLGIMILISFLIGLLPFLDNFAHIGGFLCGILSGSILMPLERKTKSLRRITWWIIRLVALALLIAFYGALLANFYNQNDPSAACPWCKYLSCLPIQGWCDVFNNQ